MTATAARERTRFAWRRTVLVVTVVLLGMVVAAARRGLTPQRAVALGIATLVWIGWLFVSRRRIDGLEHAEAPDVLATITFTGLTTTALAVLSVLLL